MIVTIGLILVALCAVCGALTGAAVNTATNARSEKERREYNEFSGLFLALALGFYVMGCTLIIVG